MRLLFSFLLHKRFILLHLLYRQNLLFCPLTTLCRYLSQLLFVGRSSTIHRRGPSCCTWGIICRNWIRCVFRTCMREIVLWPSVMVTKCFAIPAMGPKSNIGLLSWTWHVCLALRWFLKLVVLSFISTERSNVRRISWCLCHGRWEAMTKIDPSLAIIHRPFSDLYFAESFDYWEQDCDFKLCLCPDAREASACWHSIELFAMPLSHRGVITLELWVGSNTWRLWLSFCSDASGLWILL